MKKIFLLLVPILGIVWVCDVEGGGRPSKKCGKDMDEIYSSDGGGTYCRPRVVKPPLPSKAPAPVLPPMTVERFEPASAFGGEEITIYGSGFIPGRIVTVNIGGARSIPTIVSPTVLKTTVNTSAKTGPIILETNQGMGPPATSSQQLQVRTELVLTKVEPAQAKAGDFIKMYVKGGTESDLCNISVGGIPKSNSFWWRYHSGVGLDIKIPEEAKNGEIFINCESGSQAKSNLLQLIAEKAPEIKIISIYPNGGIEKNNQISIFGTQLQNPKEVTFNGKKGSINTSSSGQIRVIVPNMDGVTKIVVVTPQGSASWDNYTIFKSQPPPDWKPPPPPVAEKPKVTAPPLTKLPDLGQLKTPIPGIDPSKLAGNNGSGITNTDPLKDKGDTLPGGNALKDKDTLPGGNALKDKTKLTNTDPLIGNAGSSLKDKGDTLPGGNALKNPGGNVGLTNNVPLTSNVPLTNNAPLRSRSIASIRNPVAGSAEQKMVAPPVAVPEILGIAPSAAAPGAVITISGKNLQDATGVSIGNQNIQILSKTETTMTATVPKIASGKYDVKVLASNGNAALKNRFEILAAPKTVIQPQPALLPPPSPPKTTAQKQQEAEKQLVAEKAAKQKALQEAMKKKQQEPTWQPAEPQQEEASAPRCRTGSIWSPTLKTCVEDQQQEVAAPPDCDAGMHWSPTLKSCQPD